MKLKTIGYELASIDDFLETLSLAKISTLVDVRELPISRKRGFAKTKLSHALNERGIHYVHLKALGDPKPGREAARKGNFDLFRKIFVAHLESDLAKDAMSQLEALVRNDTACLMCYERDPTHCHRSIVANRVKERVGASISHLEVIAGVSDRSEQRKRAA